ncbi:hypothetical protein BH23CHL2_BH23CHL2_25940 [soil metagenome]
MDGYKEIGRIVRLQIQRQSLKHLLEPRPEDHRSPERYYDPQHILAADELWVADSMAIAARGDDYVLDVHAAAHPHSRNRGNGNMLSIGFTSHYDKMRERFGDRMINGIAGENILVEASGIFDVEDFQQGLAIQTSPGNCWLSMRSPSQPHASSSAASVWVTVAPIPGWPAKPSASSTTARAASTPTSSPGYR